LFAYFEFISSKKSEISFHTETEDADLPTPLESSSIWSMFRYNTRHTGRCPYDTSKNNGTLKWKFQTERWCSSLQLLKMERYAGSMDHYLYALNPDGTLKWKYLTGTGASFSISSDGTLYVGSMDGSICFR